MDINLIEKKKFNILTNLKIFNLNRVENNKTNNFI